MKVSRATPYRTWEVLLIPSSELEVLESFDGHGSITLTAYLRLDTPQRRERIYEEFMQAMEARLAECGPRPECRKAIQEDVEIVSLYLKTNGHRRDPGVVIFSCAAELFWRAYALPMPLPTQVMVGPKFNVEPLLEVAKQA
jgi:hypothetical protein